jgi:hypothetical protein
MICLGVVFDALLSVQQNSFYLWLYEAASQKAIGHLRPTKPTNPQRHKPAAPQTRSATNPPPRNDKKSAHTSNFPLSPDVPPTAHPPQLAERA